jgi:hypothetical protein
MSLLSLTVVSHSRRRPRSPPLRHRGSLYRRGWAPAMMRWISGFFWLLSTGGWALVVVVPPWALNLLFLGWLRVRGSCGLGSRRHCWLFGCGLVGSGLVVGVCHFCALYLVYLTGLPMLLSVPASCHCDRCFCHSPYAVPTAYLRSDASYGCCTYLCVPAPARCIVAYASRLRCMLPTYRSMFCTITFGAYRTFRACVRSIRAVRNHFFLLMAPSRLRRYKP